ncbi:MAG: class I SAM-dependent methyltransferase, partial [bacterium]|nr:class I SAM-dependent methyltransferase [bacterium]
EKILAIDYCDEVIEHNKEHFNKPNVEFRTINLTDPEDAKNLSGEWDYVVCNATVEHVPDDQALIDCIYSHLKPGGILVFSTVLYHWLYNKWDYAMGHYRRYSVQDLKNLCTDFDEVQIIKTSLIQELVRPLFFNRIEHLLDSSLEENNRKVGFLEHAHPPYAKYYGLIKYLMPVYFVADWIFSKLLGGIVIVIAQKPKTAQKSPVLEPVAQLTEAG